MKLSLPLLALFTVSGMHSAFSAESSDDDGNVGVYQYHNDAGLTGQNANEKKLTPDKVKNDFGKLGHYSVDGQIYGQPLYVPHLNVAGEGTHNVVYVVTEHDTVYAFDADGKSKNPLWKKNFLKSSTPGTRVTPLATLDVYKKNLDITPEIGITSTPVIDPKTKMMYFVTRTKEIAPGSTTPQFFSRVHAIDLRTGKDVLPANDIKEDKDFDVRMENQRSALALVNGIVYVAFAGYEDNPPYHGWILGFDAKTLKQVVKFNTTPGPEGGGGVWMGGAPVSSDKSGAVFCSVANGEFGEIKDWANKMIKPIADQRLLSERNMNFSESVFKTLSEYDQHPTRSQRLFCAVQ